jgi:ABC-type Fe3+-siderophore transport system permease subunit
MTTSKPSSYISVRPEENAGPLRDGPGRRDPALSAHARALIALGTALILLIPLSILLQTDVLHQSLTLAEYAEKVLRRFRDFRNLITGNGATNAMLYTLCTFLIVALTGAALSACGALYQGIFKNPAASPTLLGVQSGGTLGAVLYLLFMVPEQTGFTLYTQDEYVRMISEMSLTQRNMEQMWIFAGCFLGAFLVVSLSQTAGRGRLSTLTLFLAGMIFSSLSGAVVMLAQYYMLLHDAGASRVLALQSVTMGTFNGAYKPEHLLFMSACVLPVLAVLLICRRRLDALTLGEDEARSLYYACAFYGGLLLVLCRAVSTLIYIEGMGSFPLGPLVSLAAAPILAAALIQRRRGWE